MHARSSEPRALGVVFAGGRSERMGQAKALLPWPAGRGDHGTLIGRAARTLSLLCECVEVSAGDGGDEIQAEAARLRLPTFPDHERGAGPLAGLVAATGRARALGFDGVLALACDMPFVERDTLAPLLDAAASGADAALWQVEGVDQPLCAFYGARAGALARAALARGARRLVAAFETAPGEQTLRVERLVADENSSARLMNVNTPADYDLALRRNDDAQGRPAPGPRGPDRP